MKKLVITLLAAGLLSACQSTETVKEVQDIECTFPDSPRDTAPKWVCDITPEDLEIAAVGYAKKSSAGLNLMRDIATNDARARLAQQFETSVNTLFKQASQAKNTITEQSTSEEVSEYFETVTKNVTSRTLSNSRIIVSQRSPAGGLYTLVGMDKATYDENLAQVVAAAADKDSALWDKFTSKKASEDLEKILSSL